MKIDALVPGEALHLANWARGSPNCVLLKEPPNGWRLTGIIAKLSQTVPMTEVQDDLAFSEEALPRSQD
jgi:hypothetical protein